jgi:hypothetical protein
VAREFRESSRINSEGFSSVTAVPFQPFMSSRFKIGPDDNSPSRASVSIRGSTENIPAQPGSPRLPIRAGSRHV